MAKLHVEACASWIGGVPDFTLFPIVVAVSVTQDDGSPADGLPQSAFIIRCMDDPTNSSSAMVTAFNEHSSAGPVGNRGYYSLVVKRADEGSPLPFLQDSQFLFVAVRHQGNQAQTVCLAQYHVRLNP